MTKLHWVILGVLVLVLICIAYLLPRAEEVKKDHLTATTTDETIPVKDFKNTTYRIDGEPVELKDGFSEVSLETDSAVKEITRYFGNEVFTDLNDDGLEDVIFLLTRESGGSGQFFYVVAALNTEAGFVGSEAHFLGDRISPQSTVLGEGKSVVVNYADRAKGEPFTTEPSVGKSIRLILDTNTLQFGEVVSDFEGEASPSVMKLNMKKWSWVSAVYKTSSDCSCPSGYTEEGGSCEPVCRLSEPPCMAPSLACEPSGEVVETITPNKPNVFKISFTSNGRFSATTDCNGVGGNYENTSDSLKFSSMMSTLMYCEGSQEGEFVRLLSSVSHYQFTSKGELILSNEANGDVMVFR